MIIAEQMNDFIKLSVIIDPDRVFIQAIIVHFIIYLGMA